MARKTFVDLSDTKCKKKTTLGGCVIQKTSETVIVFSERS